MNRLQVEKKLCSALMLVLFVTGSLIAQQMPSKADKQYEMGLYDEAAVGYKLMIDSGEEVNITCFERLAECYVSTNKPYEAIETYEAAAMKYDMSSDSYMKWASALKKIGRNEEANEIVSFASIKGNTSFASLEIEDEMGYDVKPVRFNSRGNEFAPTYLGQDIVCVTDNYDALQVTGVSTAINELPHILMRANPETGKKERLRGKLKDYINDGPTSYSEDGSTVVFSKGHFPAAQSPKIGNKQSGSIYLAETDANGDWDVMISLPCNELGVANIYPYLREDGQRVYFSSNREGGFGGFDIYYTDRIGDGWSSPKNLGSKVNSSGDEISPSVDNQTLYFASNSHSGMGGFDVFSYDEKTGTGPVNMGTGVNSTWDDYALITKNKGQTGYFTSNRSGGAGGEDIYTFNRALKKANQPMAVTSTPTTTARPTTVSVSTTMTTTAPNTPTVSTSVASAKPTYTSTATAKPSTTTYNTSDDIPTFRVATSGTDPDRIKTIYTIQVAALSENNGSYRSIATKLQDIGFVYKVFYHNVIKIRVGQFDSETQARQTLSQVKARGYQDAFVVKEELIREETRTTTTTTTSTMTAPTTTTSTSSAPVTSSSTTVTTYQEPNNTSVADIPQETYAKVLDNITRYRIKLGSYTSMSAFDSSVVKRYGSIFEEKDGEFTKVYLGDYMTLEDAEAIRGEVKRAGFSSAIIYGLQDGNLVRVR